MVIKAKNSLDEEIVQDSLYKEYFHNRNLKPGTVRSYSRKLTIYSIITGLTPTQFIEQAEEDEDLGIRKRLRRIKNHLTDLQEHLITQEYSPRKIEDIITTVRGFYTYYDIEVPKPTYHAPVPDLQINALPSREEIREALNHCNQKYQSIILLMSSSGLSLGDALNLKISE